MKIFFLLCFLFGAFITASAQNKFTKGYYVTDEKDTVRGYVENDVDWRYFNSFNFKPTLEGVAKNFTPEDATSFGLENGESYREFLFTDKDGKLLDGFFKIEVAGKLTLVTYNKRSFAVDQKNQIYEITPATSSNQSKARELGYLKMLMTDCDKTNEEWIRQNYSATGLRRMFITYNECMGVKVKSFKGLKPTFIYGIQAGVAILSGKGGETSQLKDFGKQTTFAGGIFLGFVKPSSWGESSVILEANLHSFDKTQSFRRGSGNYGSSNNTVNVKYSALTIPVYGRVGRRVFADLGIQTQFITSNSTTWRVDRAGSSDNVDPGEMASTTFGILVGAGVKLNAGPHPIRAVIHYSFTGNDLTTRYNVISLGASYQFAKNPAELQK